MNEEPRLDGSFYFTSTPEFQAANKKANELGLRARITDIKVKATTERHYSGYWVKNETPPERP